MRQLSVQFFENLLKVKIIKNKYPISDTLLKRGIKSLLPKIDFITNLQKGMATPSFTIINKQKYLLNKNTIKITY